MRASKRAKAKFMVGQIVYQEASKEFHVIAFIDEEGKLYTENAFARGTMSEITGVRPLTKREVGGRA